MIVLDTSAIYAWADAADPNHASAVRRLQAVLEAGVETAFAFDPDFTSAGFRLLAG